jgi:hypothetical protein
MAKLNIFGSLILLEAPDLIEQQVRQEKGIIVGGKAIQAHLGLYARPTFDFDILTPNPPRSAKRLERTLDRRAGENIFYRTQSKEHPSTHRVRYVGEDRIKDSQDDITFADFSPFRKVRTVMLSGIRYAQLSSIVEEKKRILTEKQYAFRHEKDRGDIERIKSVQLLRGRR